jgi:hypothetical protein
VNDNYRFGGSLRRTNALQIEQTKEVRDKSKSRLIVADAVVKIISPKITV